MHLVTRQQSPPRSDLTSLQTHVSIPQGVHGGGKRWINHNGGESRRGANEKRKHGKGARKSET